MNNFKFLLGLMLMLSPILAIFGMMFYHAYIQGFLSAMLKGYGCGIVICAIVYSGYKLLMSSIKEK